MKKYCIACLLTFVFIHDTHAWGFWAHQQINRFAVYLLPPEMLVLYKPNIDWITAHAVDPDKRRYAIPEEAPRHYLDLDHYGSYPYPDLPHDWAKAKDKYCEDSLKAHGIVPWHIITMLHRLTKAFREKDFKGIMKNSAEIGHYIADAHVPLHASSNHNGQLTGQRGIHGFWESRIPELLAENTFDFFIGKAMYLPDPKTYIWKRMLESGHASDSVLLLERTLSAHWPEDKKYAFENRNGIIVRQYSSAYTIAYNKLLQGMVERRMRQAITTVACCWFTAWVDAGQPSLAALAKKGFTAEEKQDFDSLNAAWKLAPAILGREE